MHLGLNYKQKPLIGVFLISEKNQLWISKEETVGENLNMELT